MVGLVGLILEINWIIVIETYQTFKTLLDPWGPIISVHWKPFKILGDPQAQGSFQTLMQGDRWGHPSLG